MGNEFSQATYRKSYHCSKGGIFSTCKEGNITRPPDPQCTTSCKFSPRTFFLIEITHIERFRGQGSHPAQPPHLTNTETEMQSHSESKQSRQAKFFCFPSQCFPVKYSVFPFKLNGTLYQNEKYIFTLWRVNQCLGTGELAQPFRALTGLTPSTCLAAHNCPQFHEIQNPHRYECRQNHQCT